MDVWPFACECMGVRRCVRCGVSMELSQVYISFLQYCIVLPTNWLHTLDQVQVMLYEMGQVFYFYNKRESTVAVAKSQMC